MEQNVLGLCNETSASKEGERLHALGMGQRVGGILAAAFCFLLNLLNRVRKNNYWSAGFFLAGMHGSVRAQAQASLLSPFAWESIWGLAGCSQSRRVDVHLAT